ncbi:MAG TPA: hypothetical protein VMB23_01385, partial [Spirochaetia bacterium]|nr:hypothetical protein [Spirochaetia bacterium]
GVVQAGTGGSVTLDTHNHSVDFQTNGTSNVLTSVTGTSSGTLKLTAAGAYSLQADLSASTGYLDARTVAGDLTVSGPVKTQGGTVTLVPGGNLVVNSTVLSQISGGTGGTIQFSPGGSIILDNASVPLVAAKDADITFGGPVTLTLDATVGITESDGLTHTLSFSSTVDSTSTARALTVAHTSPSKTVDTTFTGALGSSTALSALTVTAGNPRNIVVHSVGGAAAGVTGNTALTATGTGTVTFAGTTYKTTGSQVYTAPAGTSFLFTSGAATTVTTSNAAITFTTGDTKLSALTDLTLTSAGGAISLGKVDGTAGAAGQTLTATASGGAANTISVGAVGTATTNGIHSVVLTAPGGVTLNGSLTTDNTGGNLVQVTGPTVLGTSITITTAASTGGIAFVGGTSTINGTGSGTEALALRAGTGDVTLGGVVGGTAGKALASLAINTGTAGVASAAQVSVAGVGSAGTLGVAGATDIAASTSVTFTGGTYRTTGTQDWYAPAGTTFVVTASNPTTFQTANAALAFHTGSFGGLGSWHDTLTLDAGTSTVAVGSIGAGNNDINTLAISGT